MTQKKFRIGDIVRLKSGGPDMAVNDISPDGTIYCTWFSGKKNEKSRFHPDVTLSLRCLRR